MNKKYCPIQAVTKLISGNQKMPILSVIQSVPKRFGKLKRILTPLTEKMLVKQLREQDKHNLLLKKDFQIISPKVEYTFTNINNFPSYIFNKCQNFGK